MLKRFAIFTSNSDIIDLLIIYQNVFFTYIYLAYPA